MCISGELKISPETVQSVSFRCSLAG